MRGGCRRMGKVIRRVRKEKGLTPPGLASASGLSASSLCEVEGDKAEPSLGSLREVARGLGVPLFRLLLACEGGRRNRSGTRRPYYRSVAAARRGPGCCRELTGVPAYRRR